MHELKSIIESSGFFPSLIQDEANRLSRAEKVEILKAILERVQELGYEQCSNLLGVLSTSK